MLNGTLPDFEVYYNYARIFLSGGNPYAQNVPLNYPPSALLFFSPFSLLSQKTTEIIFTILSLSAFFISIYLLTYRVSLIKKLAIIALLFQSFPTKFTLGMGQVNLIVLFFVIFSFIKDRQNKQVQAGIFWGSAVMIKLIPLPLAIYFLIRKRYKALMAGLSLFFVSNLTLIFLFPSMTNYFQNTLPGLASPVGKGVSVYDQSLRAFFMRMELPQSYELSIFIGIFLLFLGVMKYLKDRHDLTFFSLILAVTTISNSFAWQHHFVLLYPAFIAAIKQASSKNIFKGILLTLSYILISYHFRDPLNPPINNPFFLSHTLIGSIILIWLLFNSSERI